jgi:hypothetical protein
MRFRKLGILRLCSTVTFTAAAAFLMSSGAGFAQPDGQVFSSPDKAAKALVKAAEDQNTAAVQNILGPSSKDILDTSDNVADTRARQEFVTRAKEKMSVANDPDQPGQKIMELGKDRWPFPVPIVKSADGWRFDVAQGKDEILLRRVGDNELTAIDTIRGYVEAQNDYYDRNLSGDVVHQYAQKMISTPGQHDGLYWPSAGANDESPMGDMVANAMAEGYTDKTKPYHGYFFKILKSQGPDAPGGAKDYVDNGAMTKGFAAIAWPADYKSSGVMTFIVSRPGIVYEKNLGANTAAIAADTNTFNPDNTWKPVSGLGVPTTSTAARSAR